MVDFRYKVCIFGDSTVGKTTLTTKYITGKFFADTRLTMGINIRVKQFKVEKKTIELQIWDFGGEERFRFMFPYYSNGAFGGIFMYDITNESSLLSIDKWMKDFKPISQFNDDIKREDIPMLIVGGKLDLADERMVSIEDAKKSSKSYDILDIIECSSKTDENVESIFETITKKIMSNFGHN